MAQIGSEGGGPRAVGGEVVCGFRRVMPKGRFPVSTAERVLSNAIDVFGPALCSAIQRPLLFERVHMRSRSFWHPQIYSSFAAALVGCICVLLSGCGHKSSGSSSTGSTYLIGGTISGLNSGAQVTLSQNGGDALTISANGGFTFSQPMSANGSYLVAVVTQPAGETCAVSNYTGSGIQANVANVNVVCSVDTYALGGTVSGLAGGNTGWS